jgi:hypothetical protein
MAKYMLARGNTRLPIDGIRTTLREGLPPLRQAETVLFSPGVPVESDLDFGPWVTDGTLIRIRERGEPPRPPQPDPLPAPKPALMVPLPAPAEVEVVKEAAPEEPAPREAIPPEPDPDLSVSTRPRTDKKKRR